MATPAPLFVNVATGAWGSVVCAVRESGRVPAKDFLDSLSEKARARFLVLFQQMANAGDVSFQRFKSEMDGLFAFRCEVDKRQIRFPCFQDGNRWVLTHGFYKAGAKKKKGKWPQNEIDRALEIRGEYFTRKKEATKRGS